MKIAVNGIFFNFLCLFAPKNTKRHAASTIKLHVCASCTCAWVCSVNGADSGTGPNIRVGGNSADESAWVPAPAGLPAGDEYRITDIDLMAYVTAVPLWGGSLTLGTFS